MYWAEGSRDAIIQIGEQIHPKLFGSGNQRLKGIPGSNPLTGTCLQTDIAGARPAVWLPILRDCCAGGFRDGKGP